jgi:hypothetical protein
VRRDPVSSWERNLELKTVLLTPSGWHFASREPTPEVTYGCRLDTLERPA